MLLFDEHPCDVKMWIDFWVICDDAKAHLFFMSHAGWMWRSKTPLDQFPVGWNAPAIVLRGDIFEASHMYRLKEQDRFLTLVEAQDEGRRYLKAFLAKSLDGEWSPLAATREKPLASLCNVDFSSCRWTESFSHPELIRSGIDQRLKVEDYHLIMMFQAFDAADTPDDYDYDDLPWELSIMTNDSEKR